MGEENVGSSQKKAQSKGLCSLLASSSTGMMSTSQNANAGRQTCYTLLSFESGEKNGASFRTAVSSDDGPFPHGHCCDETVEQRSTNRADSFTFKQKTILWCLVTLMVCLHMVTLAFCAHLYGQMREQNEMMQTILKDSRSLRVDYQTVGEENLRLREEFEKSRLRKELSTKTVEENAYTVPSGQNARSSDVLMQLLRSNGFGTTDPQFSPKRVKRHENVDLASYIETVVTNHLQNMPKVHLKGMSNDTNSYMEPFNQYMVWQPDPVSFVHRGVTLKKVHHQHNRIKAIEIEQAGIYLVYSQIIVNGSHTNVSLRRDCSHQTVVLPYHDYNDRNDVTPSPGRVLMSGFVTQDAEGRYPNHSIPLPRDSSLQMGIFRLARQSQVRVRIPTQPDCRHTIFATSVDSSYFGLYRIA